MSKLADAKYPIHPLIQKRWSPRAFADRAVEAEKLLSLLEAARWAASSRNQQPWNYMIAGSEEINDFEKLLTCLADGNRYWARYAPVLMLVVAKDFLRPDGGENRIVLHDVGLAMGNLTAQATALDLHVHIMGGFSRERARQTFNIPEPHEPVIMVALGYLGEADSLSDGVRERELAPRTRKDLAEFVFSGHWGTSSPLVVRADPQDE